MTDTKFDTTTEAPRSFQCRHIFTDGHRCGSKCLRREEFCYYHHTTRRPVATRDLDSRKQHREVFAIPNPEDRSAIQHSIGEVLRRIAANDIDPRRAGLLLYGLQIASLNLPKHQPSAEPVPTVEDIDLDADLGILAPRAEVAEPENEMSEVERLLNGLVVDPDAEVPVYIHTLEGVAEASTPQTTATTLRKRRNKNHRARNRKRDRIKARFDFEPSMNLLRRPHRTDQIE